MATHALLGLAGEEAEFLAQLTALAAVVGFVDIGPTQLVQLLQGRVHRIDGRLALLAIEGVRVCIEQLPALALVLLGLVLHVRVVGNRALTLGNLVDRLSGLTELVAGHHQVACLQLGLHGVAERPDRRIAGNARIRGRAGLNLGLTVGTDHRHQTVPCDSFAGVGPKGSLCAT